MFCKNCGKEIDDKAVICVHCGVATGSGNSIANGEKSWLVTLLLCFFLGSIGAHRFYTGHTGTAVAQLILTCTVIGALISGPWILIDLIMIIMGSFKTIDGRELVK